MIEFKLNQNSDLFAYKYNKSKINAIESQTADPL